MGLNKTPERALVTGMDLEGGITGL